MIGSHNSMTFLPAKKLFWRIFTCWWKCLNKSIILQISLGVRWFDVRIAYDKNTGAVKFAHGKIDLNSSGLTLKDVLEEIQLCGGTVLILLEKGTTSDELRFAAQFDLDNISRRWPCIVGVIIKKKWKVLWRRKNSFPTKDCFYLPYKSNTPWWKQLGTIIFFPWKSIKARAKECIPTESQKNDNKTVWIFDYV